MMARRTFSTRAVLAVYFNLLTPGEPVYFEAIGLLEYLFGGGPTPMRLHDYFADERIMEALWTQFPALRRIPAFDAPREPGNRRQRLRSWTADAISILGGSSLEVASMGCEDEADQPR
jgi:hypothetical protein